MNNLKIIKYEMKRLLFSKVYLVLILITGWFSYNVLKTKTIYGLNDTAPFSEWSYSGFLLDVNPFLLVIVLVFCTYIFSKREEAVRTITMTTKIKPTTYFCLKSVTIAVAYLLTVAVVIAISFIFYNRLFQFNDFSQFIKPIILILIPSVLFVSGMGMFIGNINGNFLYIFIPIIFLITNSGTLSIISGKNLVNSILESKVADTMGNLAFDIPQRFVISRIALVIIGISLIVIVCKVYNKTKIKA
ncbi:hypothetical protein [Clostridioides sp. ES-S-0190-01]|uniref:hypothetical protein n=1 Tax=Clostridioides sp. ES-S-0190-01 TaxID=2770787 RepID=UPI001D1226DD|nr:hypothetical protein [Clostridioides sp. ES-S-0190-01]